jgi:hypothetical protein
MEKIKIAKSYSNEWLEVERPQPLIDNYIEKLTTQVINGGVFIDTTDQIYVDFKKEMTAWLLTSKLNKITGLDNFNRVAVINGCTQFIDNVYMQGAVQTVTNDYRYHQRLKLGVIKDVGRLIPETPLIIAMPFPSIGDVHTNMKEILDEAQDKGISVHVDGAWFTCCREIDFDLSHPAIKSVGISLSKGLGLGWNRIGLRWTKSKDFDAITIMNDFNMNLKAPAMIGLYFLRNLSPDYLWNTHGERYQKVCVDFGLTPTKSIHLALRNGSPVGVSPLIRYLENASA